MSDQHRNELKRRFLGAVKRLAFRSLARRENELDRRDEMILRIRSLFALERMGALPMSAISSYLDCAHSSTISAMRSLERGQLVHCTVDPVDPGLRVFDMTGRGQAVTDRLRYLLEEYGVQESVDRESDQWESMRSDEVDKVLRLIQSFANEDWKPGKLYGRIGSEERNVN